MSLKDRKVWCEHCGHYFEVEDVGEAIIKFKALFPDDNEEDEYIINRVNEIFGDFDK